MTQKIIIAVLAVVVILLALPLIASIAKGKAPEPTAATTAPATPATPPPGPPQIVSMDPPNAATNVKPGLTKLVVTFDRPMAEGFSWTGGGPNMPEGTGRPFWMEDQKTCVLPVNLKPNWSYRLGINSPSHKNFRSEDGTPVTPTRWTFQTGQ